MNKTIVSFLILVFVIFIPNYLPAAEISRADAAINSSISAFVLDVTNNPGTQFYQYTQAMMIGFLFLSLALHVIQWAVKEITTTNLFIFVIGAFLLFAFYLNYNSTITEFWSWSDSLAAGIQQSAVGTTDPLFIGSRLSDAVDKFFISDISLWDGFQAVVSMLWFRFISMILNVVIFIISLWHVWGYAFVKITGLIFLPLALLPLTRSLFEVWFKILLGFWFFNLFSKVCLTIYYLYFFAIFGVLNDPVRYDPIVDRVSIEHLNLHLFFGIVFLLASAGFASMVAGGFSGITRAGNGLVKTLNKIIATVAK